ncbi:carbohydrate ABC transporter substrate-binding protein, CUT1 family [Friedmanniella luteola]|uniref:Carbohydrate ABC transporter substrate-binding protein, CUT1 family n=1 Tax=Friedmanniella luteola TaxID=546871 RepID=A0A1H1XL02_9ACTN|nr:sugar ABC transporter substrate-binding protein [Friedmanniella luteola]SDT09751.1 carbohydrate ABC transporter substrate-binding protein, CUT1 family [Friedmanniella luteola]
MRKSRFLKIATAATAAVMLAGCSGGGEPSSSGSGSGDQPVELTWFMWSGSDVEKDAWIKVGDMVTAKYPNITIKFETTPFNDFWTKLTTEAASGQAACIVGLQGQRAPQFGSFLLPLDDYMAESGVKAADYVPSIMDGLKYEGQQVAIPYDVGPYVMFYNKDAFKAAGLAEPKIGWTTEDFTTAAKTLTKAPKYGYFARSDIGDLMPWVLSQSGKAAVDDQGQLAVDNAEWKATAEWYTRLITEEKVAAQVPSANSSSAAANQFLSGNAYMAPDGPWSLINTRALAKFDVGIAPMPAGAAGSKTWSDGSGFGITQSCKNPDEAFKAISVITGAEAETYLAEQGRAYPALISTQQAWYEGNKTEDVKPVMDYALQNSVPFKTTPTWQQVTTVYSKQAVATYNGQGSVDELLSQTQAAGAS